MVCNTHFLREAPFPLVRAFEPYSPFVRFGSVRPVRKIITFSRQFFGVYTWKNARFTAWGFEHLKFLDFQVSKKRCPKVGLAFTTGRGRDPVLSPFWWTFSKKLKCMFYQKEFNLLGIWRKKSNWDNFRCSKTSGLMEFSITSHRNVAFVMQNSINPEVFVTAGLDGRPLGWVWSRWGSMAGG